MQLQIALETELDGRTQAWVLDYPGCFAYATNLDAALAATPDALLDYTAWISSRNQGQSWVESGEIQLNLMESWQVYCINDEFELAEDGYEVSAWFRHDWKPLSELDIERSLNLLDWSRADLLDTVQGLSEAELSAEYPGERWNINGILRHVGGAEWWYLDRLGLAFARQEVPKDAFERLAKTRQHLIEVLPGLAGSHQVIGVEGEFWSPRKLLRRALWHERDHTQHIRKLLVKV